MKRCAALEFILLPAFVAASLLTTSSSAGTRPNTSQDDVKNSNNLTVTFEVSSVKQNKSDDHSESFGFPPNSDRFRASNAYLARLIQMAYGINNPNPFDSPRVVGLPNWAKTNRYDIEAKIASSDVPKLQHLNATQQMLLLKPLLHDRFGLIAHFELREMPGYALEVTQGGSKLHEVPAPSGPTTGTSAQGGPPSERGVKIVHGELTGEAVTMSTLARALQTQVGRPVIDHTGLAGFYDVHLSFAPRLENQPVDSDTGPSIFTAVQEQLGLKLVSSKQSVDVLIIDHVESPAAN
jgi:uncharacterized protein (TIGR03435 family)